MARAGETYRPGEALDELLGLVRAALRTGYTPGPVITALARDLHARSLQADRASEVGNDRSERETIDGVREYGTPDEAGIAVGLTGRRVRQLCAAGLVAHRPVGKNRYLVDLSDLQRHLRGEVA